MSRGTLALVGTPIGNLGDITYRAVETLRSADRIFAEDTRRTRVLLSHLQIEGKRLHSLHAHSTARDIEVALEILEGGETIALVTDAGMPGISDPGAELVRRAREAGVLVTVIPGPSAVTSAIALAGFGGSAFHFLGFLPRRTSKRREAILELRSLACPIVFFESPRRIQETLAELHELLGPRAVVIGRELTKKFEEVIHSTLDRAGEGRDEWLGELTIVVEGARGDTPPEEGEQGIDEKIKDLLRAGLSTRDVVSQLSGARDREGKRLSKRDLYGRAEALRTDDLASSPGEDSDPEMC